MVVVKIMNQKQKPHEIKGGGGGGLCRSFYKEKHIVSNEHHNNPVNWLQTWCPKEKQFICHDAYENNDSPS